MKSLAKVILAIGAVFLVGGVVAKLINSPLLGSKPMAIFSFADSCLLLAIGLLLVEDKK